MPYGTTTRQQRAPAGGWTDALQRAGQWAVQQYRQLDAGLGGLLPYGGTGNAASKPLRQALGAVRDRVIVPGIDAALGAGAPPVPTMFGRYLTGTSKPLNELPPGVNAAIRAEMDRYQRDVVNWDDPRNFTVRSMPTGRGDMGTAYGPDIPDELSKTLGQYEVRGGHVRDRYTFQGPRDATDGGTAAQNIIRMGQELGILRRDSGFEIDAPLRTTGVRR